MKKLFFMVLIMLVGITGYSNHGEKENYEVIYRSSDGLEVSVISKEGMIFDDDDALYCKIECDNGNVYECWFCKCNSLPSCDNNGNE